MIPGPRNNVSAPSSSLLRFLRSQSEEICCFTTNPAVAVRQRHQNRALRESSNKTTRLRLPSSVRNFATSQRRGASVEVSRWTADSLRRAPVQKVFKVPAFATTTRPGTLVSFDSHAESIHRRYASIDTWPLLNRIFKQRKADSALKPNDLPPLPSFLDDAAGTTLGRNKPGKGSNELKLRCTELNENGNVTLVNGEFKKSELIAKVDPRAIIDTAEDADAALSTVFSLVT